MKRIFYLFSLIIMVLCSFSFVACENAANVDSNNQEIKSIYQSYVVYAETVGESILSYEEWLESINGKDGREIELQATESYIQWRYVGATTWTNLIDNTLLIGEKGDAGQNGANGKEIELSVNSNYIIWRYSGEEEWNNLTSLSILKGEAGLSGKDGLTPYIKEGNWWIGTTDLQVKAQAIDGKQGEAGNGIKSIAKTSTVGNVDTYTITFTDETKTTFSITNGKDGENGKSAYELAVDNGYNGTLNDWLASLIGETGQQGLVGKSAYELAVENGFNGTLTQWLESLVGDTGEQGLTGKGIQSIVKTSTIGNVDTYTITFTDGDKTTFSVTNGIAGENGKSAYELAVENGYNGSLNDWLDSLQGQSSAQCEHDFSEWIVEIESDCEHLGYKTRQCSNCNIKEYEFIEAKEHVFGEWITLRKVEDIKTKYCSCANCGFSKIKEFKPSEGLTYELNSDNISYSVIGLGTCADLDIVIPSTYNGLAVTCIGTNAFNGCATLNSIEIPNSVISTGTSAFNGCSNLKKVYFNGTIDEWAMINFNYSCPLSYAEHLYINDIEVKDVVLTTATKIDAGAFRWYVGLESIVIGDSVKSIGLAAFGKCENLETVVIGDGVELIEQQTFYYCSNLSNITIGKNIKKMVNAFYECNNLENVYYKGTIDDWAMIEFVANNPFESASGRLFIDNKVVTSVNLTIATYIGAEAFENCSSITKVTIPTSVKNIGSSAFSGCKNLNAITFAANSKLESIGSRSFYNCTTLQSVTVPNSVVSIGSAAFENCTSLKSVTFMADSKLESIEEDMFNNCTALQSVDVGNNITSIGKEAFYNCSSLKSITIPKNVTSMGSYVFYNCNTLTEINFNAIAMIDLSSPNMAFFKAGINGSGITLNIGANVTKIPAYLFDCSSTSDLLFTPKITTVIFAENSECEKIGDYAFKYCISLETIALPDSVKHIGYSAFYCCGLVGSITIGINVESIDAGAFSQCTSLTSIVFVDNTATWCYSNSSGYKGGPIIDVTDSLLNVTNLTHSYSNYCWNKV